MRIGCSKHTWDYNERGKRIDLNDEIEIQYEKGVYVAKCINEGRCNGGDASELFSSFL